MRSATCVLSCLFLLGSGDNAIHAGYVVVMGDSTVIPGLAWDISAGGNRQLFRNLAGGNGSVVMIGHKSNYLAGFYESTGDISSRWHAGDVTLESLEDATLVVSNERLAFTASEVDAFTSFVHAGGNLLLITEPATQDAGMQRDATNALLVDMHISMAVTGHRILSYETNIGSDNVAVHPLTSGVSNLSYGAAWCVWGGEPLFFAPMDFPIASAVFVPEPSFLSISVWLAAPAILRRRN